MILSPTTRKQGQRGCRPFPLHPQSPPDLLRFASDHLSRTISLDEAEHFLHNHHASVASLRLLFTFTPERRSACLRNRCSPSPEYPKTRSLTTTTQMPIKRCCPVPARTRRPFFSRKSARMSSEKRCFAFTSASSQQSSCLRVPATEKLHYRLRL